MKILMLTDRMGIGGAETHVFELARALVVRGNEVFVASSGGQMSRELLKEGIPHITLPLASRRVCDVARCYATLLRLVLCEKIDIIHAHARIPALIASLLSKQTGICFVSTAHAKFSRVGIRKSLSFWGERTVAVSEDIKQYLIDGYGLYSPNITVIPNGMDTERFYPAREQAQDLTIGFLSRLDRDCATGARLLCKLAPRLVRKYGKIKILIGGGGNALREISELAAKANRAVAFECVKCVGIVSDTPRFMRGLSVFVGVSRAACEAALCGASVILCGDEGFSGRLTCENFERALSGNFCAREGKMPCERTLFYELDRVILDENREGEQEKVRRMLVSRCDIRSVARATESFYKNAKRSRARRGNGVLLCGYYGFGNVGDDALLRASIARATCEFEGVKISALTKNGKRDENKFSVKCVCRSSPIAVISSLMSCRYFVLGGGTLLQDSTSLRSLVYYFSILRAANLLGARCYMWGNGIGELSHNLSRKIARRTLCNCKYIGVRDARSEQTARELLPSGKICADKDLACSVLPCTEGRADAILQKLFGHQSVPRFIIIALKQKMSRRLLEAIADAKKRGIACVFVVMHRGEDLDASRAWSKCLGGYLLDGICFEELCALARVSLGVYSMRLHALIAARVANVPAHAFGNEGKIKDFSEGLMYL